MTTTHAPDAGLAVPSPDSHGHGPPPKSGVGRLGPMPLNFVRRWAGMPWSRRLARAALLLPAIRHWERKFDKIGDAEMRRTALTLRGRARGGESLNRLLPEAFGLCSVACWRGLGMRPFDVQVAAGVVLHHGALAELATGEGKTLTAIMPTFLNALPGKGAHVASVNDYLAQRDAEFVERALSLMGMSVGCLFQKMEDADRTVAYRKDITYGTAAEFGFDFLRDRLKVRDKAGVAVPFWTAWTGGAGPQQDPRVQRPLNFVLVDEADSIFVDEARTPLIIASATRPATPEEQVVFHWADQLARTMVLGTHFKFDPKKDKIELLDEGKELVRYSNPPTGEHSHAMDKLHEHIERAVQAHHRFVLDQHYMVEDGKIVIIDEGTGRRMPDRHWREGLHQAVEAKERVEITKPSEHAAQITFQNFYKQYKKFCGMSGTARQNWWELRRVYRLWVVPVPTNRPSIRKHLPDKVFPTEDAKFDAVVEEVRRLMAVGRPVLIGTRSVEKSDKLSALLTRAGVEHQVLSARHHANEAIIVSSAGQPGRVTVATNMAGRGTDIKLGPGVAAAGGLAVIGTERHEAARVDRQLIGRAGRQGDPGTGQFFLSLEDEILEGLGLKRQAALIALGKRGGTSNWDRFAPLFKRAQRRTEAKHYRQRLDLMFYDRYRQETLADLGADPFVD